MSEAEDTRWGEASGAPKLAVVSVEPDPQMVRETVHALLRSEALLTALRTVLPKGDADKEYGFDYIPFLLESLDQRRKWLTRATYGFLALSLAVGTLFSVILVVFGYALINESAAGTTRRFNEVNGDFGEIRKHLPLRSFEVRSFEVRRIENELRDVKEAAQKAGLPDLSQQATDVQSSADARALIAAIGLAQRSGRRPDSSFNLDPLQIVLSRASSNMQDYLDQIAAIPELEKHFDAAQKQLSTIEQTLENPSNRTAELVKRLAVSLIVSTFFLALLRYLAGLYREHSAKLSAVERNDWSIRKFYTAYKCALGTHGVVPANVLSAFVTLDHEVGATTTTAEREQDAVTEVVKELLKMLSKKL